jgi:Dyp-type peroxidase family
MAKTSPTNFLAQTILEVNDLANAQIYNNMQGNILKGHGRDHATMIFISFKSKSMESLKNTLFEYSETYVTSFYKQLWERERFKRNNVPGDTFGAIFITKKGFDYLGEKSRIKMDTAFKAGMKDRKDLLNDPDLEEGSGYNKDIHAMLLLADDDKTKMDILAGQVLNTIEKVANILHIEYGDSIRNSNGDGLEHNGYVDGVSQPLFLKDEVDAYIKQHGIKTDSKYKVGFKFNPIQSPGLVLINDPYVKDNKHCYGSYFVFRKLEQNVRAFKKQEEDIGKILYGKDAEEGERIGARLVGRFEDGTPIQEQGEEKMIGSGAFNNFNYTDPVLDPSGGKCPHFAHIRKTNQRTGGKFDDHTMARRGIPYGHRNVDTELEDIKPDQFPTGGVGLLFMSYQKSIVDQFEFIQIAANANNDGGVDPIIGQTVPRENYDFPNDGDVINPRKLNQAFDQHINFKGGEYFFAPSMAYLKSLETK